MFQSFYQKNNRPYCKLYEDDESTFALTFYKNNKHVNAILSDMSKDCREDLFYYIKEKYDIVKIKYPEHNPVYMDLNNLLNNFCKEFNYNLALTKEQRMAKEKFIFPEERTRLNYLVIKELSKKYYITNKGILVERETK